MSSKPPQKKLKQIQQQLHFTTTANPCRKEDTPPTPTVSSASSSSAVPIVITDGLSSISTNAVPSVEKLSQSTPSVTLTPDSCNTPDLTENLIKTSTSTNSVPLMSTIHNAPFHPPASTSFKKTGNRCCHATWFTTWPWMHYDEVKDCIFCFTCTSAIERQLMPPKEKRSESAFTDKGFCNWKKGPEYFGAHEKSEFHLKATMKIRDSRKIGIDSLLSKELVQNQRDARKVLNVIFSSIRFLGRQGFPLRGTNDEETGAFYNLMKERTLEVPIIADWLRKRDTWMSNTIQNECLQMFAHEIQAVIAKEAVRSHFLGLTADSTTDIGGLEQYAVCVQYTSPKLDSTNQFLGFYNPPDSKGETLSACIQDVFIRLALPLKSVVGYSFDTTANMSGIRNGVQAHLKKPCPDGLYVPCANHSLDLVLQETSREVPRVSAILDFVKDTGNIIRESAKRRTMFALQFENNETIQQPISLCPTRWCIRGAAMKRLLHNYKHMLDTLTILQNDKSVRSDSLAKIRGLCTQASKATTYVALQLCWGIFSECESVAEALQGVHVTAYGALSAIQLLKMNLLRLRANMEQTTDDTIEKARSLCLIFPVAKRQKFTPAKLCDDESTSAKKDDIIDPWIQLRSDMYSALDLIATELDDRFNNHGMQLAAKREEYLVNAATVPNMLINQETLNALILPSCFDQEKLMRQLKQLFDFFQADNINPDEVQAISEALCVKDKTIRQLFDEVERYISMCLCMPCSNASSERSFSSLRRLKTWLRTTMTQQRLTHVALMHVHASLLESIDMQKLIDIFICKNPERRAVFGNP